MAVYKIIHEEMKKLPCNEELTEKYCSNWSGILCVDGKYVAVRGYEKKIPFIYAIDYATHDIPVCLLALNENIISYKEIFSFLKKINYPLKLVVGDDNGSIKSALNIEFPGTPFQLCQTHYLENIRQVLHIRTESIYRQFFFVLITIFKRGLTFEERMKILSSLKDEFWKEPLLGQIISDVYNRYDELFAFENFTEYVPHSNNLIEAFNSHLNGRLKTIKGFESIENARLWLNAWVIRRRTKPFTDCELHFKDLNGKTSMEMSLKSNFTLEQISKILYRNSP